MNGNKSTTPRHSLEFCAIIFGTENSFEKYLKEEKNKRRERINRLYILAYYLTSPPTASSWKLSSQETLASSTSSPSSSKASSIATSIPGQFLSENTLMRKPLSRVSTVT